MTSYNRGQLGKRSSQYVGAREEVTAEWGGGQLLQNNSINYIAQFHPSDILNALPCLLFLWQQLPHSSTALTEAF